jgi:hypothetical protein
VISSREVRITIVATLQLPHETSVPEAVQQLSDILPNTLRELGFVPKLTIDIRELSEDED